MRKTARFGLAMGLVVAGGSVVFAHAWGIQKDLDALCVSRAGSLAFAIEGYAQDYDENFPPKMTPPEFQVLIAPYDKDPDALNCPATGVPYTVNVALAGTSVDSLSDYCTTQVVWDTVRHRGK